MHNVRGTLFNRADPRICTINNMRVTPTGRLYAGMCQRGQALIIGRVCGHRQAGVNIANLMLGRDAKGGHALTVLNLDAPLDEKTLAKIQEVPHVMEVRLVALPETHHFD